MRLRFCVLLTLGSIVGLPPATAQQQSPSGAVEIFAPAFDVGIVQRPQAGLYGITELMMAALEADIPMKKLSSARQHKTAGAEDVGSPG